LISLATDLEGSSRSWVKRAKEIEDAFFGVLYDMVKVRFGSSQAAVGDVLTKSPPML